MNPENFRPTLAASLDDGDPSKLTFPMIASPKVDGIRVVCHPTLGPVTRSLKQVSNEHVRRTLSNPEYLGLDGEITVGPNCGPNVFADTTGAIRAYGGTPDFTYWVFDEIRYQEPYQTRFTRMSSRINDLICESDIPVAVLKHKTVMCIEDILQYEIECLARGFEGIMLRSPMGKYKFGRSTFKEQILIKVKRFKDDEATIIGYEALEHNTNEQVKNALGLSTRSSHKAGRVTADNMLGTLVVDHPTWGRFGIGSGFDFSTRTEIWSNREAYLGRKVTFKYQPIGAVDKPRFPIFMRFRDPE